MGRRVLHVEDGEGGGIWSKGKAKGGAAVVFEVGVRAEARGGGGGVLHYEEG